MAEHAVYFDGFNWRFDQARDALDLMGSIRFMIGVHKRKTFLELLAEQPQEALSYTNFLASNPKVTHAVYRLWICYYETYAGFVRNCSDAGLSDGDLEQRYWLGQSDVRQRRSRGSA